MTRLEMKLMDASAVNPLIDEMRSGASPRSGCIAMAKLALKSANLTACGRAAWEAYLAELESVDTVAMLERLAAAPKPFVAVETWQHEDGTIERRDRAPQPRLAMAENGANGMRRFIGRTYDNGKGGKVRLIAVDVEERQL